MTDSAGRDTRTVRMKDRLHFDVLLSADEHIPSPSAGLLLFDRFGNVVFAAGTRQRGHALPRLRPRERLVVRLTVSLNVQPGLYTFSVGCSEPGPEPNVGHIHDLHEMLGPIEVVATPGERLPFYGIAELPMTCRHGAVVPGDADATRRDAAQISERGV